MASSAPPSATAGPTRVFFSFTSGFLESGSPELAPWEEKKTAAVALATSKIQATQVENLNAGAVSEQPCDIPAPAGEVTEAAPITTRRPVWYKAALLAAAVLLLCAALAFPAALAATLPQLASNVSPWRLLAVTGMITAAAIAALSVPVIAKTPPPSPNPTPPDSPRATAADPPSTPPPMTKEMLLPTDTPPHALRGLGMKVRGAKPAGNKTGRASARLTGGRRGISFGDVNVREYSIVAGGCGSTVSHGIPLGLGWFVVDESKFSLELFEAMRRTERRGIDVFLDEARVSAEERERRMVNAGMSEQEMLVAQTDCERTLRLRDWSCRMAWRQRRFRRGLRTKLKTKLLAKGTFLPARQWRSRRAKLLSHRFEWAV